MFNYFIRLFHLFILSAIVLSGCGFKGDPVYRTKEGKKIEFNATMGSDSFDANATLDTNVTRDTNISLKSGQN